MIHFALERQDEFSGVEKLSHRKLAVEAFRNLDTQLLDQLRQLLKPSVFPRNPMLWNADLATRPDCECLRVFGIFENETHYLVDRKDRLVDRVVVV